MYAARMPCACWVQLAPSSSLCQTPPLDSAIAMRRESRGSTQI
jgi:hypothetical protein